MDVSSPRNVASLANNRLDHLQPDLKGADVRGLKATQQNESRLSSGLSDGEQAPVNPPPTGTPDGSPNARKAEFLAKEADLRRHFDLDANPLDKAAAPVAEMLRSVADVPVADIGTRSPEPANAELSASLKAVREMGSLTGMDKLNQPVAGFSKTDDKPGG